MSRLKVTAALSAWALAAIAAGALWWQTRPVRGPVPGVVAAPTHVLASPSAGRLLAVTVAPGEAVEAGQALARLRTDDIDAELAVARAELTALIDRMEAESVTLRRALQRETLDTQAKLAQAQANLAGARAHQAAGLAERKALSTQLDRLEGALREGLTAVDHLTGLRARERSLARSTALTPMQLKAWQTLTEHMNAALLAVDDATVAVRLKPLAADVAVQRRRLEALLARREARILRAPAAGVVAQILHRTGDTVAAGEPVVQLRGAADQVVAWLPAEAVDRLVPGQTVNVQLRRGALQIAGVVDRMGPALEALPAHLWLNPDRPRWGRPAYVRLTAPAAPLVAGEPVQLSLGAAPTGALAAAPAPPPGPALMTVPKALWQVSRFEPSGGVWVPALGRVLMVSDDTGLDGEASEGAPWVFGFDPDGHVDPAPIPLHGLAAAAGLDVVSDLESITRSPDGDLWLLASQSVSRKGKRKPKRQLLLQVRPTDGRLVVLAAAPLFPRLRPLLTDAEAQALDIEAMTWVDGALLLGLKAPLDAQGHARLWRLADPAAAARGDAAAVPTPVGAVALPTGADGAPGGFSDLLLDGGRLLATSTLADGPAQGCAWQIPWPLTAAAPKRLACWPDLKPEGLARTPQGVQVYFDAMPPRWAPLP